MVKEYSDLEIKCKKTLRDISRDIRKIKNHLSYLKDIDQKVSHILTELRQDYYYGLGLKNFFNEISTSAVVLTNLAGWYPPLLIAPASSSISNLIAHLLSFSILV